MKSAVKTAKRQAISKGIQKVCGNVIEWRLNGKGLSLSALDLDNIINSLINNGVEGELRTITPNGNIANGWWNVQW